VLPLPPKPEPPSGGGQDGAGAGSAAGVGAGAGFLAGAFGLGAAFFATFLVVFFAAFTVLFFLRAGAAFFLVDFFFAFDFFAMIVLPIQATNNDPIGPFERPGSRRKHPTEPASARGCSRAHRPTPPMLPKRRRTRTPGGPIDQFDRMDGRKLRARSDLRHAADIACCNNIRSQSLDSPDFALAQPSCDIWLQNIVRPGRATT
jgi:hypothetical protein